MKPIAATGVAMLLLAGWAGRTAAQSFTPVFVSGQDGYACYRIPAMVTTTSGVVIAMADGRISGCADIPNPLDLVMKRSFDDGRTWSALQVVANYGSDAGDTDTYPAYGATNIARVAAGDAALLVDRSNNRVWVLYDNGGTTGSRKIKLEMRYSDDDGATWSPRLDIEALNPGLRPADPEFLTGPGNGIQLTRGPWAGRLIFPVYGYLGAPNYSTLIYSDDHGQTWRRGGVSAVGGGESQIAELPNGDLLATIRDNGLPATGVRYFNTSTDGGLTWGTPYYKTGSQAALPDPMCQGSILRWMAASNGPLDRVVFANAASPSSRINMTLRVSADNGRTWSFSERVYGGSSGYSALAGLASGEIGLLFESDSLARIDFIARRLADIPAAPRRYKVFILTGQSNSLGATNAGEADPSPGVDPADAHVLFFWHNWADASTSLGDCGGVFTNLVPQQGGTYPGSETHWGPEINFARTLVRAGTRDLAVVKCSRGGGGNTYWLKASPDDHMYRHVVDAVTNACANLTAAGDTFEIAGLLYLQGESDDATEAAAAGTRFKTLVDNLRADLPNAGSMVAVIGGIAAAGATRDTVRTNQAAVAAATAYIDYVDNLDLQTWTAADALHFNKAAKLRIGERYAQAFLSNGAVSRQYGRLAFIGDSITQGGNGRPGYRYNVFGQLASRSVPVNSIAGYTFAGSVTGAYQNSAGPTPDVGGQAFGNVHDGHYGWRAAWVCARTALPAGRYGANNLGTGTLLNWTGQSATFTTADAGSLPYTGATYVPDVASIMIGINDLADGTAATQVRDDIGTMIDQLRAANPGVRIFLNKALHTNQGAARDAQVDALNALLPALAADRNAASTNSPVWLVDADTGFDPATMTVDGVHPNAPGEAHVGNRIAAALGIIETPMPGATGGGGEPPHVELDSGSFPRRFEGHDIWNGAAFTNGWTQSGSLVKSLPAATDLQLTNATAGGSWIEGTASGWTAANAGNWTFETRLKFNANPNGFALWLGTGTQRIIVEIFGNRTQDYGSNAFSVTHNNLDGQFHTFRVAHDAVHAAYHVWRDGARLTPTSGVAYDVAASDARLILGDYTSGVFGNHFDAVIDYVRYDQTDAWLPPGADADNDGLPDTWEYDYGQFEGTDFDRVAALTRVEPSLDDDRDGFFNAEEYVADTDPFDPASALKAAGLEAAPGNVFAVTALSTSPQRTYTLHKTTDLLKTNNWIAVDGPNPGTGSHLTLQDTNATVPEACYRVQATLP